MNYSIAKLSKLQALGIASITLAAAYLIGSRALDTGSLWQYLLSFLLVVATIQHLIGAIKNHRDGKN